MENKTMIGVIVAVLVLVGAGVGIFAMSGDDETTTETQTSQSTKEFLMKRIYNNNEVGIWGGMTEDERRLMLTRQQETMRISM